MSITTTTETVRPWQQLGGIMQPIAAAKKKKGKRSGRAGEMQAKLLSKPQSFPATPRVFFFVDFFAESQLASPAHLKNS